jgi:hypothetical protein
MKYFISILSISKFYREKKMIILLKIFLILKLIKADCPFKETIYDQPIIIRNFNNLSQLEFNNCNETITGFGIFNWGLKPNKKLILDNSLNFKGLKIFSKSSQFIHLINFKGFDLLSNPFDDIYYYKSSSTQIVWYIDTSNFNFYINNKLINEKECLNNTNTNWNNLITNSKILFLLISNTIYSSKVCPFIFKNALIQELYLNQIKTSFVNSNILSFNKIENTADLNTIVLHVDFSLYRIYFDENLLNLGIFKYIQSLQIDGVINGIQNDLFKSFTNIKVLRIQTQHVKKLFATNNKWFEYLNNDLNPIDLDGPDVYVSLFMQESIFLIIYQTFSKVTLYDYPNEDFCLFSKFPHDKLVFPKLKPIQYSTCSCTELYLIQNSFKYNKMFDFYSHQVSTSYIMYQYYMDEIIEKTFSKCFQNEMELYNLIRICDFKQRLNKCKIKNVTRNNEASSYFEMYDWQEVSKISSLIFSVYLNSIFSLIVIIINILTLLIIKSKTIIKEKNAMYNFLFINTNLTLIYILIYALRLIGICIENDYYCSPLNETKFNIYYKTIIILFCGETLKTASNFSYLSFSLSRYIKVTSTTKLGFLLKFDKLKKRYYFLISLIIAVFINLYHLFEYNFNLSKLPDYFQDGLKDVELFYKYSNPNDEFIEHFTSFQYYLLNTFFYIKLIFSDLSYIVLNLIIDLKLLSFIKYQNSKKIKIISQVVISNNNNNNSSNKTNKKSSANSNTNRLTSMVIFNGLNCFILRFPIALTNMYGFIFRFDKSDKLFKPNVYGYIVCRGFKICSHLQDIFYFLYILSLLIQFLIFFHFDILFRKGYNEIKLIFLKKFKKKNAVALLVV